MKIEKLHLGCGVKHIPGFYHVDALDYPHVDRIGPVEDLSFIPDGTVELIYACHVLEHFGRKEYRDVLAEWCRVLAPGGVLRIAVPDFRAAAELYLDTSNDIALPQVLGLLVGGQRDQYDYHKMVFDEETLSATLIDVGFSSTRRWDWRTTEHSGLDDYSQAYLPHMAKDTGRLVSLNLEGVK
ncbi:methyltransferase domain-containing protein [Stappia sp. 28M-7]|jgi:predicted SAM-dependent methyltransferase|uniref:class I SAM-dependent methyltransferase n=1 Tax=Stappia sp. 28M-7 TaxID=2762596 RepID=UPI000E7471E0|nr:methyltransferase domain-containing protein [Stappia sp. 28M-7]MBC2861514.1 methyltransferase domain-containing protein [Stappia sp. 28M-7]